MTFSVVLTNGLASLEANSFSNALAKTSSSYFCAQAVVQPASWEISPVDAASQAAYVKHTVGQEVRIEEATSEPDDHTTSISIETEDPIPLRRPETQYADHLLEEATRKLYAGELIKAIRGYQQALEVYHESHTPPTDIVSLMERLAELERVLPDPSRPTLGKTVAGRLQQAHEYIIQKFSEKHRKDLPIKVVDLGIGHSGAPTTFDLARALHDAGFVSVEVVGVDMNSHFVDLAQNRIARELLPEGVHVSFQQGSFDLSKAGIHDADLVVSANVFIYYETVEEQKARELIRPALKKDGLLAIVDGPKMVRSTTYIAGKPSSVMKHTIDVEIFGQSGNTVANEELQTSHDPLLSNADSSLTADRTYKDGNHFFRNKRVGQFLFPIWKTIIERLPPQWRGTETTERRVIQLFYAPWVPYEAKNLAIAPMRFVEEGHTGDHVQTISRLQRAQTIFRWTWMGVIAGATAGAYLFMFVPQTFTTHFQGVAHLLFVIGFAFTTGYLSNAIRHFVHNLTHTTSVPDAMDDVLLLKTIRSWSDAELFSGIRPFILQAKTVRQMQSQLTAIDTLRREIADALKEERRTEAQHLRDLLAKQGQQLREQLVLFSPGTVLEFFDLELVDTLLATSPQQNVMFELGRQSLLQPISSDRLLLAAGLTPDRLAALDPPLRQRLILLKLMADYKPSLAMNYLQNLLNRGEIQRDLALSWSKKTPRLTSADAASWIRKLERSKAQQSPTRMGLLIGQWMPTGWQAWTATAGLLAMMVTGVWWFTISHSNRSSSNPAQTLSWFRSSSSSRPQSKALVARTTHDLEESQTVAETQIETVVGQLQTMLKTEPKKNEKDDRPILQAEADRWSPDLRAPSATQVAIWFEEPFSGGFLRTGSYHHFNTKTGEWVRQAPNVNHMPPAHMSDSPAENHETTWITQPSISLPVPDGFVMTDIRVETKMAHDILWDPHDEVYYIRVKTKRISEPIMVTYGIARGDYPDSGRIAPTAEDLAPMNSHRLRPDTEGAVQWATDLVAAKPEGDDDAAGLLRQHVRAHGEYTMSDDPAMSKAYAPGPNLIVRIDNNRVKMSDGHFYIPMVCNVSATEDAALVRQAHISAYIETGFDVPGGSREVFDKNRHAVVRYYSRASHRFMRSDPTPEDRFDNGLERSIYGSDTTTAPITERYRKSLQAYWDALLVTRTTQRPSNDQLVPQRYSAHAVPSSSSDLNWMNFLGRQLSEDVRQIQDLVNQGSGSHLVDRLFNDRDGLLGQRRNDSKEAPIRMRLRYEASLLEAAMRVANRLSPADQHLLQTQYLDLQNRWQKESTTLQPSVLFSLGHEEGSSVTQRKDWDTSLSLPYEIPNRHPTVSNEFSQLIPETRQEEGNNGMTWTWPVKGPQGLLGFANRHQFFDQEGRPIVAAPIDVEDIKEMFGSTSRQETYALARPKGGSGYRLVDVVTSQWVPLPADVISVEEVVTPNSSSKPGYYLGRSNRGEWVVGVIGSSEILYRAPIQAEVKLRVQPYGYSAFYLVYQNGHLTVHELGRRSSFTLPSLLTSVHAKNLEIFQDYSGNNKIDLLISHEPGQEGIYSHYSLEANPRITPAHLIHISNLYHEYRKAYYFTAQDKRTGVYHLYELKANDHSYRISELGRAPGPLEGILRVAGLEFAYRTSQGNRTTVIVQDIHGRAQTVFGPYQLDRPEDLILGTGINLRVKEGDHYVYREIIHREENKPWEQYVMTSTHASDFRFPGYSANGFIFPERDPLTKLWSWRVTAKTPAFNTVAVVGVQDSGQVDLLISNEQSGPTMLYRWDGHRLAALLPADHNVREAKNTPHGIYWRGAPYIPSLTDRLWRLGKTDPVSADDVDVMYFDADRDGQVFYSGKMAGENHFGLWREGSSKPIAILHDRPFDIFRKVDGVLFIWDGSRLLRARDGKVIYGGPGQSDYPHNIVSDGRGNGYFAITENGRHRIQRTDGVWVTPSDIDVHGSPVFTRDGAGYYVAQQNNGESILQLSDGKVLVPFERGTSLSLHVGNDGNIYYLKMPAREDWTWNRLSDHSVVTPGDISTIADSKADSHFDVGRLKPSDDMTLFWGNTPLKPLADHFGDFQFQSTAQESDHPDLVEKNDHIATVVGSDRSLVSFVNPASDLQRQVTWAMTLKALDPTLFYSEDGMQFRRQLVQRLHNVSGQVMPADTRVWLALLSEGMPEQRNDLALLSALSSYPPDQQKMAQQALSRIQKSVFETYRSFHGQPFEPARQGNMVKRWLNNHLRHNASHPWWLRFEWGHPESEGLADFDHHIDQWTKSMPWLVAPQDPDLTMSSGLFAMHYLGETARQIPFWLFLAVVALHLIGRSVRTRRQNVMNRLGTLVGTLSESMHGQVYAPTLPNTQSKEDWLNSLTPYEQKLWAGVLQALPEEMSAVMAIALGVLLRVPELQQLLQDEANHKASLRKIIPVLKQWKQIRRIQGALSHALIIVPTPIPDQVHWVQYQEAFIHILRTMLGNMKATLTTTSKASASLLTEGA